MTGLFPDDLLADLESLHNDDDTWNTSEEMEYKYDPSLVKTETEEGQDDEYNKDRVSFHFLEAEGDRSSANEMENEDNTSKKKRQRVRKMNIESDDDSEDKTWTAWSSKPMKMAKKKAAVKRAPKKETTIKKEKSTKRKLVSEMTPEEAEAARAIWREETRKRRERQNATDEEREAKKAKWREEARLKRQRQRESLTEAELEANRAKCREQMRLKRQKDRENLPKEEREAQLAKQRERKRKARDGMLETMPPEELGKIKEKTAQRKTASNRSRKSMMTEEEKEAEKQNIYLREQARLARKTPEELEEMRRRKSEREKERYRKKTATLEEIEKLREERKQYLRNLTPEKRAKYLENVRESNRKKMERLRQNPEQYAAWMEKHLAKKRELNGLWKKLKTETITKDELTHLLERMKKGRGGLRVGETPEERLKRFLESRMTTDKNKTRIKNFQTRQKRLRMGKSYAEIRSEKETPEQRSERLMRRRIDDAKRRALKHLQAVSASHEEIERKLIEVEESYVGTALALPVRPFTPRKSKYRRGNNGDPLKSESQTSSSSSTNLLAENQANVNDETPSPSPRKGRSWKSSKTTSAEAPGPSEYQTPFPSRLVDKQVSSGVPGPSQPYPLLVDYNQQQYSSHNQACHTPQLSASPSNFHDTYESSNSSSPLNYNDNHNPPNFNYDDLSSTQNYQHKQEYSSSESFEPMASPATPIHSHGQGSSPERHDDAKTEIEVEVADAFPKSSTNHISNTSTPQYESSIPIMNPATVPAPTTPKPKVNHGIQRNTRSQDRGYFEAGRIRGPQKNRVVTQERDKICDECGVAYSSTTLSGHKRLYHNPHFKDHRCVICGEAFTRIRDWYYQHFRVLHLEYEPKRETKKDLKRKLDEKKRQADPKRRPFMCTQCGKSYATVWGLQSHEKVAHTDFSEEDFFKCDFCDKKFKRKQDRYTHHYKMHGRMVIRCERCEQYFANVHDLREHLKNDHVNSYYNCQFCGAVQISEIANKFHINTCKKVPRDSLTELRKRWSEEGSPPVDQTVVGCEFCSRTISVHSLGRHYVDIHGLTKEDLHKCTKCKRTFKRREFFVCHMASVHEIPMKECLDIARPYNVPMREGLVVLNKGVSSLKRVLWKKKKTRPKKSKLGKEMKPLVNGKRGRGRPRKIKAEEDSDEQQEDKEKLQDARGGIKVKVEIGEQQEEPEAIDIGVFAESRRSRRQSAVKAQTRIRLAQKDLRDKEEEVEDECDDDASDGPEPIDDHDDGQDGSEDDISNRIKQEVEWDEILKY